MAENTSPAPVIGDGEGDELHLRQLWSSLVRNRWLILGTTAAALLLAALYTQRQRPVYEAGAYLRIEDRDQGSSLLGAELAPLTGLSRGKLETDMLVLRSRSILGRVVDSLHLNLRLTEPASPRDDVLVLLDRLGEAPVGRYEMVRGSGGRYTLSSEAGGVLLRDVAVGPPFRLGTATMALAPAVASTRPERIRFTVFPPRSAVDGLRSAIRVVRPDPVAYLVGITFQSTDPALAAAVPNAVAETFIRYTKSSSRVESSSAVEFLREQVSAYEGQVVQAEDRLRRFREEQQVVNPAEEASQGVRRLADLQAQHDALRAERAALAQLLERVAASRREGDASPYRQLATFPVFLQNRAVQDILQSLTALENERAQMLLRRTEVNPDVSGLNQRISELELQLFRMAQNYLATLDSQIASAETSLRRFGSALETIPSREVEFARLSRQEALLAQIYNLLQTRLKEAEIREAIEPGNIRMIDPALTPLKPVSPRPMRNLFLGGVLGLLAGIAMAFAREALDTKVRTREDVEQATGGAVLLATVPRIRRSRAARVNGNGNGRGAPGTIRPVAPHVLLDDRLVTLMEPRNPASEAYRALRTNLTFSSTDHELRMLVVTSAMPGEGKSTTASNLAVALAEQGTRTLLVDADLRRGVLHTVFGQPSAPGLTNVLLGRTELADAVHRVSPSGDTPLTLDVLTTGTLPPNPAELLGSLKMRALMERLRQEYEMVVIDAPPLNMVTDAAVLGVSADATLLVARNGVTDRGALGHATRTLATLGVRMGGVILNGFSAGDSYGYGYGYGYGYYGAAESR